MEVKKIPSWYENQQVREMANKMGLIIYILGTYYENEDGTLTMWENPDAKYSLLTSDGLPSKIVPYRMTFYELKDTLIFWGGFTEEVI